MARHRHRTTSGLPPTRLALVAAVLVVLVVGGVVAWQVLRSGDDSTAAACSQTTPVRVSVAPELAPVAQQLLASPVPAGGPVCAAAQVVAEDPLQTLGDVRAGTSVPDVWVPDSSLWPARVEGTPVTAGKSMATSPLVIGASRAAAQQLGWLTTPPSWLSGEQQALAAGRPFAKLDLVTSARGLATVSSIRQALGGGAEAETGLIQGLLAIERGPGTSASDALAAAARNDPQAPAFTATEQDVVAAGRQAGQANAVAVYATDGAPVLDYPVVRVGQPTGAQQQAVDAVVSALTSDAAQQAVRAAGFRSADGAPPDGVGDTTGTKEQLPAAIPLDPATVWPLADRITALAAPSRLLAVIDVSQSMSAPLGGGNRVTLARDAAKSALALFPNTYSVGLWTFAVRLDGDRDYAQKVPLQALDSAVGGTPQRDTLEAELDKLPGELAPGGTGLYDTTLAAVRAARQQYQPGSVASVVLLTDGANDKAGGISLQGLLDTLRGEKDASRPVELIAIGLGPDADLGALGKIVDAAGGQVYPAQTPEDVQKAFVDALRRRG